MIAEERTSLLSW